MLKTDLGTRVEEERDRVRQTERVNIMNKLSGLNLYSTFY